MSNLKTFYHKIKKSPKIDNFVFLAFKRGAKQVSESKIVAMRAWKADKTRDFKDIQWIFEPGFGH